MDATLIIKNYAVILNYIEESPFLDAMPVIFDDDCKSATAQDGTITVAAQAYSPKFEGKKAKIRLPDGFSVSIDTALTAIRDWFAANRDLTVDKIFFVNQID